jgi:hypothetical protein
MIPWSQWWELPGPKGFLERLIGDLRDGINLVIAMPETSSKGFKDALAEHVRQDDMWYWCDCELTDSEESESDPLVLIGRSYATDLTDEELLGESDLARSNHFQGKIILVSGLNQENFSRWTIFLKRYADVCRNLPAHDRGLICLLAEGLPTELLPHSDVAVSVRCWRSIVTVLDQQIWQSFHLGTASFSSLEQQLRLQLGGLLAGTDPYFATEIASISLETLLSPLDWLRKIAKQRGWTEQDTLQPKWHRGMLDEQEGRSIIHPALASLSKTLQHDIQSHIWQAQLTVFFPLIELERKRYIKHYQQFIKLPFRTDQGVDIHEIMGLEIGHLWYLLKNRLSISEKEYLRRLRDIRNTLAHMEILHVDEIYALLCHYSKRYSAPR